MKSRGSSALSRDSVALVDPTARPRVQLARILQTELFLYAGAVGLHRGGADSQSNPDLTRRPAFADQFENSELAICQALDRLRLNCSAD